jgi:uncharacterized protein with GYD domain
LKPECGGGIPTVKISKVCVPGGVVVMAKYMVLFNFGSDAIRRFVASPSDRAAVVRGMAESVGGSLECYYWMFGQYDGMAVLELPDADTAAATMLAIASSGAFTRLETHELIEASDLTSIAERARGIAYQPPGWQAGRRPSDTSQGINPVSRRPR